MILLDNFQYIAEDGVLTNAQATERILIFDEKVDIHRRNVTLQLDVDTRVPLLSEDGKYFALIDLRDLPVVLTDDDEGIVPLFIDSDGTLKLKVKRELYVNYVQLNYGEKATNLTKFLDYLKRTRHVISFLLHDTRATFHVENLDAPINEDYSAVLETTEEKVKTYVSQIQETNGVVTSGGHKLDDGWHLIDENGDIITEKKLIISNNNDPNDADKVAFSIQSLQDNSLHRIDQLELEVDSVNMLLKNSTGWELISTQRIPLDVFIKRNKMIPWDWTGKHKGEFFMVNEEYELIHFTSSEAYNSRSVIFKTHDHIPYGFEIPVDHYQGAFLSNNEYQKGYDIRKIEIRDNKVRITTVNGLHLQGTGIKNPEIGNDVIFDYCGIDEVMEDYLFKIVNHGGLEYLNTFLSPEEITKFGITVNCTLEETCPSLPTYEGDEINRIDKDDDYLTLTGRSSNQYKIPLAKSSQGNPSAPPPATPPSNPDLCMPLPTYNGKLVVAISRTAAGEIILKHEDGSESIIKHNSMCPPLPNFKGKEVSTIIESNSSKLEFRHPDGTVSIFECPKQLPPAIRKEGAKDLIYAALLGVLATNGTFENRMLKLANVQDTEAEEVVDGIIDGKDVSKETTTYVDNETVF